MAVEDSAGGFVESAKDGLSTKIGGVPFYVFGGVAVVGFYLWKRYHPTPDVSTDAVVGPDGTTDSVSLGTPGQTVGFPTANLNDVNTGATGQNTSGVDLEKWISDQTTYLVSLGYDASNANSALRLYATGATVTGAQQRLVSLAISNGGSPPGAKPPAVGVGAGISFDIPSNIVVTPQKLPRYAGESGTVQVTWRDGFGQPITGTLYRQAQENTTGVWLLRDDHVKITNGVGMITIPTAVVGKNNARFTTAATDTKHLPTTSNVVALPTIAKPKPAPVKK